MRQRNRPKPMPTAMVGAKMPRSLTESYAAPKIRVMRRRLVAAEQTQMAAPSTPTAHRALPRPKAAAAHSSRAAASTQRAGTATCCSVDAARARAWAVTNDSAGAPCRAERRCLRAAFVSAAYRMRRGLGGDRREMIGTRTRRWRRRRVGRGSTKPRGRRRAESDRRAHAPVVPRPKHVMASWTAHRRVDREGAVHWRVRESAFSPSWSELKSSPVGNAGEWT